MTKHLPLKLLRSCKLKPLWVGLYKIVYTYGDNAYKLELPALLAKLHLVFNITLLKRYIGDVVPALDPFELDDGAEYEVDAFLHR